MAKRVIIEGLFESDNSQGQKPRKMCYWAWAYFWNQTTLFDSLEPDKPLEKFWASVNAEHPKMYPDFAWPEREKQERRQTSKQLALLSGDDEK